jgi:transcriptional regulator with XRE-family HTH domain
VSSGQPAFGKWIKDKRKEKRLTQEQLEIVTGYSQPVISAVENGDESYSADFVIAIADALDQDESLALQIAGKSTVNPSAAKGDNNRYSELQSIYKRLSDEDQIRLLDMAKSLKQTEEKLKKARPALRRADT